ncbi:bifunctional demethylmenaquinone methyltransferase/2-methoxy-6-polyprenyl-1,4-benzoquinol methylase UbiE [Blastopirellula sp. J2-11]|uniref:bifunctional demethylmenaquinone methyltransferase/2-methoxy-6-polyprenyl-1,4-benzoquinol methylase UbiE n=1 Tax=Blastopirellula sp. J2-11 TaxID=2943192 RepID=UPI0021C6692C|nr:bifunctional demethylmenaquinone methyltransferase/2-methoxy-6-polyprenyl-1,4-benzoquinol methylase UbiE [Blastopirellula sp. J2-11]UUO08474.1 bifunctional demethylmenaquinone methyltransferase/2-methoxy-6-polyprenyl-1,4-benzoquinol methylase UbiE [Blastopirellula sp. J2-11]
MVVDKSETRVRRMFAEIAGKYDRMNHLLSMNVDRYWRWRTVKIVPPTGDAPILDVCTGTGDLALAYYRAAKGKVRVDATDFCPEMLEVGEEKKNRAKIGDMIRFQEADTQALPFKDDTFQIVSVAFGLRNVTNTDLGLSEMTRVCRPGGKIAVLEFSIPTWQPFKAFYLWYFRNILPMLGRLFAKNREDAYKYLPDSVGEFPYGEALAERMRAAGLQDVFYKSLTFGIATLYVGTK